MSSEDPSYDPRAYHGGQVWTIATAWAADAAFSVGEVDLGLGYLRTIAERYEAEEGFANECYRGDRPEPFDSCYLLGFSVAPFLRVLFERLWGISLDALHGSIEVRPRFPATWTQARIDRLRVGRGHVALEWTPGRLGVRWTGPGRLERDRDRRFDPGGGRRLGGAPPAGGAAGSPASAQIERPFGPAREGCDAGGNLISVGRREDGMSQAIEVRGLVKQYDSLMAVDHIDFSVPAGKVFAFLGPNGAGKTTTTEILEGLRRRTEGDVRVLDLDPWKEGYQLHRKIGVIPQDFRFFEKLTPREGIEYYAALFGTHPDPMELLHQVALEDKSDSRYDTLSGGQKQKMGLALALTNDPQICFLDEPTTGLDPHARRAIWEVIRTLRKEGRTVFLTTHYLEEAELLADQVAIIHHGQIIAAGTPGDIIRSRGRPERLVIEGPPALADYLRSHGGASAEAHDGRVEVSLGSKGEALRVLNAVAASGIPWEGFTTTQDTLEDVFVRLVGQMDDGTLKSETRP